MITINNINTVDGKKINLSIPSQQHFSLNAEHLTLLPGLIDPHVHFRTPGLEHKEDWRTAAKACIYGGYTTVFDMPNVLPPTITEELLIEKKKIIDAQLVEVNIPLRYQLFFGADKNHFTEISKVKNQVIGIKVFMGCSTGDLVIDDDESLATVFKIAAEHNMLVAVHAEDEHLMQQNKQQFPLPQPYNIHSQIRSEEVARKAVSKAIELVKIYGTQLYILHVSTAAELTLIKQAKQAGLPVYAETTPHHLFLNTNDYTLLAGKAIMNPPLRSNEHQAALWQGIEEGVIDTIGSDHAPHTSEEKNQPYGCCPSGVPGIETTLPLLLNAYHKKFITLDKIIKLTSANAKKIFGLTDVEDFVLVDLNKRQTVDDNKLQTKCRWSPFNGKELQGWPVYTIVNDRIFVLFN